MRRFRTDLWSVIASAWRDLDMTHEPIDEKEAFNSARRFPVLEERMAYVQQVCSHEPQALHRVLELLRAYDQQSSFLESPAVVLGTTTDAPAVTERPGTVIGPYTLREQIGEGGMGLVFVAEQLHPVRRKVALKVIKPGLDSRQVIARFEAERQTLALMGHPNIAKVHDGGTTPQGRPYFVMELVKGRPITDYCDAHRLTTRDRLTLFLDVCHAVQHAHRKGIIHRDLKPSNVLVEVHDVRPVVKVIDFGIAKATGQQLTDHTLYTGVAQLVGTPLYMSPEQAGLSSLDVDTRSDVYALGVLLYELLTGTTPFDSEALKQAGYDEMRRIIREDEPPKPSTRISTLEKATLSTVCERRGAEPRKLSQQVRGELDWIVMKALEKDRNRRYESASAFAADVQRYLDDEPVQACPPSAGYRLKKFARRNKAGLVTTGLVAAALVLGTGVSVWQAVEATAARGVADQHLASETQAHQDAVEQGQRAQNNFRKAMEAVHRMLTRVADEQVAAIPQMKEIRQRLLEDAIAFYTDLIALNPGDGQAYFERGKVYHLVNKYDQAEADFLQAIELDPEKGEFHHKLSNTLSNARLLLGSSSSARDPQRILFHAKRAVELQPTEETHRWLANVHRWWGQTQDAVAEYKKAASFAPGSAGAYIALAEADALVGDHRNALANLQKAVALAASNPYAYMKLAETHFSLGEPDQALAAVNKGLGLSLVPSGSLGDLYHVRGNIYLSQRKYALALLDYNKASEVDPESNINVAFHVHRAWTHSCLGHYEQALADLARAVELRPDDISPLLEIPKDLIASCPDASFCKGILALADKTLALLSGKLETQDTLEAMNSLGVMYWRVRKFDRSIPLFEELVKRQTKKAGKDEPATLRMMANLGVNYRDAGRVPEGLTLLEEAFERALKLKPFPQSLAWVGTELAQSRADSAQATVDYAKLIDVLPNDTGLWMQHWEAFFCSKQWDTAERHYAKAIEQKPDGVFGWIGRGMTFAERGEWAKAAADFTKAAGLKEAPVHVPYYRALLCLRAGDADSYRKICASMLERWGTSDFQRLWTCVMAPNAVGDPIALAGDAEKAVGKEREDHWFANLLGAALYRAGRYDAAARQLTRASTLNPDPYRTNMIYTWFFLAMTHHRLGHALEARQWLDKAIQATDRALDLSAKPAAGPPRNATDPAGGIPPAWNRRLTLQLLRREAVELLKTEREPELLPLPREVP
jgi:serine/threonine protein kinase/Flp pilus assembly protein TadD